MTRPADPPLSIAGLWRDTVGVVERNSALVIPLAAAFVFLPQLLVEMLAGPFDPANFNAVRLGWSLLAALIGTIGQSAIIIVALDDGSGARRTMREVVADAVRLVPAVFLTGVITGLAIGLGLFLLVVPGLYLIGRLVVAPSVIVAERLGIGAALARTMELTRGRAWRVTLFFVLLGVFFAVAILLAGLVVAALGAVLGLIGAKGAVAMVTAVGASALGAVAATFVSTTYAVVYGHLRVAGPAA